MPEDTVAHHGMVICCEKIIARLMEDCLLERALAQYPTYDFVITGHSLGAGLAVLIGAKLRSMFPDLKVFGFATPAGLLSREAAMFTEEFVFTLTVGDDFVARMSLEGVETLKMGILETLQSSKLPKVGNFYFFKAHRSRRVFLLPVSSDLERILIRSFWNPDKGLGKALVRYKRNSTPF